MPIRVNARGAVEILLVRTSAGRWIIPKGKREAGESAKRAARRECREEAGVDGVIIGSSIHVELEALAGPAGPESAQHLQVYCLLVDDDGFRPEPAREPRWFKPKAAKRALAERRRRPTAKALAAMIDWAVMGVRD